MGIALVEGALARPPRWSGPPPRSGSRTDAKLGARAGSVKRPERAKALRLAGYLGSPFLDTRGAEPDLLRVITYAERHAAGRLAARIRRVCGALACALPVAAALAVSALAAGGCGSSGLLAPVADTASVATLSDFRTSDLGSPSAFDIISGTAVRTDITSGWDFLYYITSDGTMQLRPRDMVLGGTSGQGIQKVTQTFENLTEAPSGGYTTDAPVTVSKGDVLAVVSRSDPNLAVQCRYFMKMEITAVDTSAGTITFRYLTNPNCEQRILQPGQGGG